MPLIPADVVNVAFSKSPIGKRGYHEDEVDAFLDLVQAELTRLIGENNDLRSQVEQLDQQLRAAPADSGGDRRPMGPPGPVMAPPPPLREPTSLGGDHNVHAAKVLGLAQEMADKVTGEARAEADGMLNEARTTAEQLLAAARAKSEGMVTEARTRAETMLTNARTTAEALEGQSREKAASLEREAARKHAEVLGGLHRQASALEKKTDELRAFEREYRAHLKTYLQSQLRELDGRGPTAPADPIQDPVTAGSSARGAGRRPNTPAVDRDPAAWRCQM